MTTVLPMDSRRQIVLIGLVVGVVAVVSMAFLLASRPTSSASNLLVNPGFEVDANGDGRPDGWSNNGLFARINAPVHEESFAGSFRGAGNKSGSVQQTVPVAGGTAHQFSGWVQAPSTSDAFTFQIKVQWRRGGTALSTVVVRKFTDDTAGGWQAVNGSLSSPAGSTSARVILAVSSLSSAVHIDQLLLSQLNQSTPTPTATPNSTPTPTATPTTAPTPTATPSATPTPTPGTGVSAVLVGAGDIANCTTSEDEGTATLLDGISGTIFTAGDNAYPDGTASNFSTCFEPTWGRHRDRIRPAPGNHDYHTGGAAAYYAYFGGAAGSAGLGYYAYDVGEWRIYSLNSQVVSAQQVQWLQADLAANPRACVAAYWHHPRFATGYADGSHKDHTSTAPLWDSLVNAGAELVINGHSHQYERFAPKQGMLEVIVGTGGTGMHPFASPVATGSEVRNASDHGVLELTLDPGGYSGRFIPIAGKSFTDSFAGTCH